MTALTRREIAALTLGVAATAATSSWARTVADWRLGFKTPPETLDSELALIEGRLPPDLQGSFYRVGPAQFERAGERLGHWFDGDGMVQRFAIADGRVRHRGRFVLTDKRRKEQAAGRFLYPGYGFAPKTAGELRRVDDINAANTNVLPIAGEIWAARVRRARRRNGRIRRLDRCDGVEPTHSSNRTRRLRRKAHRRRPARKACVPLCAAARLPRRVRGALNN